MACTCTYMEPINDEWLLEYRKNKNHLKGYIFNKFQSDRWKIVVDLRDYAISSTYLFDVKQKSILYHFMDHQNISTIRCSTYGSMYEPEINKLFIDRMIGIFYFFNLDLFHEIITEVQHYGKFSSQFILKNLP